MVGPACDIAGQLHEIRPAQSRGVHSGRGGLTDQGSLKIMYFCAGDLDESEAPRRQSLRPEPHYFDFPINLRGIAVRPSFPDGGHIILHEDLQYLALLAAVHVQ